MYINYIIITITTTNTITFQMLPETNLRADLGDIALPFNAADVILPPPPPDLKVTDYSLDDPSAQSSTCSLATIAGPLPSPPEDQSAAVDLLRDHARERYELRIRQDSSAGTNTTTADRSVDRSEVRILTIVQDEQLPPVVELLADYGRLTALYLLDTRVKLAETTFAGVAVTLRTLVMSHNRIRRLPASVFLLQNLETLKLDRNRLEEIPVDICKLKALKLLSVDHQRPR